MAQQIFVKQNQLTKINVQKSINKNQSPKSIIQNQSTKINYPKLFKTTVISLSKGGRLMNMEFFVLMIAPILCVVLSLILVFVWAASSKGDMEK